MVSTYLIQYTVAGIMAQRQRARGQVCETSSGTDFPEAAHCVRGNNNDNGLTPHATSRVETMTPYVVFFVRKQ